VYISVIQSASSPLLHDHEDEVPKKRRRIRQTPQSSKHATTDIVQKWQV